MADFTKTEEQDVEKSVDEEVEKTPHTSEADSGVGWEGNSSASVHSAEKEEEVESDHQGGGTKKKNLDLEDEPRKKLVSIVYVLICSTLCFKASGKD